MNETPRNPLLADWSAPSSLPDFAALRPEHFAPALEEAMQAHRAELDAIAANPRPADFDNTVAAFDRAGRALSRVSAVFHNLGASHTSPELQAVQRAMAGPLAAHESAVYMHAGVFRRVADLHERRASLGLAAEQLRLLERMHLDYVRAGAKLDASQQARYAAIMQELAQHTTAFAQNVLHDESTWALDLGEGDLDGLPESVRTAAAEAARERKRAAPYAITLTRSSILPFLTFSKRRDLREQAWRAWTSRGEHPGEHDNRPLVAKILRLRKEQAQLHGYATYADYALVDRMARKPEAAGELLRNVWTRSLAALEREREALDRVRAQAGDTGAIEAWDWRYWSEQVRQRDYAMDDAQVKPYFSLDAMVAAAFDCAARLFGVTFERRTDLATYPPAVNVYEVSPADSSVIGLFLHDNFARPTKRSGAWMSSLTVQSRNGGQVLPIVLNNNNFAKGAPTLLSFEDVRTLFHEFGHGLHGLLSNVTYAQLSGTSVLRDFVELPSQLFEHWMSEPDVLRRHARHVETGEPIPDALIARLQAVRRFGQAYETVRYTASALVDMAAHQHANPEAVEDWAVFEADLLRELGAPPAAGVMHRLVHFQHLFSGDSYAAGYYVYLWAEVLDADAYGAFREAGDPFARDVAQRLLRSIYSSGNSIAPGDAYRAFRGRDATIEPLLEKKGLLEPA